MFSNYKDAFSHIDLERRNGILQMRLHTDGGPLRWGFRNNDSVHAQLGEAFYRIARDPDNRVLILTGTGNEFLTAVDEEDLQEGEQGVEFWDRMTREGSDILRNFLDVGAIVISAVNGPVTFHPELPTMADMVVASDTAVFADKHMSLGAVPGDGAHIWWSMLLGPNRGRSFLLTSEHISAAEAKQLGFVMEVVPQARTLPRAWEIAESFVHHPPVVLRNTRAVLTQDIKRRLLNDLQLGFSLESLAALK